MVRSSRRARCSRADLAVKEEVAKLGGRVGADHLVRQPELLGQPQCFLARRLRPNAARAGLQHVAADVGGADPATGPVGRLSRALLEAKQLRLYAGCRMAW